MQWYEREGRPKDESDVFMRYQDEEREYLEEKYQNLAGEDDKDP